MSDELLDVLTTENLAEPIAGPFADLCAVVVEGPQAGSLLVVDARRTIGSSEKCDLVLTDRTVSRRHVVLEPSPHGVSVVDQQSLNGTWLGSHRIEAAFVGAGGRFKVGTTVLAIEPGEAPEDADRPKHPTATSFGRFVGRADVLQPVYERLEKVSPTDVTVLLEGESGTGKELLAEAIHEHSARRDGPFVVVDCGAVAENLAESELFGHERGAFTGADRLRKGAFERAHGGTIFLDEIGELPVSLQTRLLRVLDRRNVARVGGASRIDVDVRVIAATNRNLEKEVEEKRFRLDLYHRLAVVQVRVPPLCERTQDLELLARHLGLRAEELAPDELGALMARLRSYRWPGNVRELRNFVERYELIGGDAPGSAGASGADPLHEAVHSGQPFRKARAQVLNAFTRAYVAEMLKRHDGNVSQAAEAAGVARRYFYQLKGHS